MSEINQPTVAPSQIEVEQFWQKARKYVGFAAFESFLGTPANSLIQPPVFQFSADSAKATEWATKFANQPSTELVSALSDFQTESLTNALPNVGDLAIVCDGAGRPRALGMTVKVSQVGDQVIEQMNLLYPRLSKQQIKQATAEGK